MRRWIARLMASWLVLLAGCGGGEEDIGARRMAAAMHAQPRQSATSPDPLVGNITALFEWAEWKYPDLFPKGPQNLVIVHQGARYTIRAYANGNYLGVMRNYEVYGLGPFTDHQLRSFGYFLDFIEFMQADACPALGMGCSAPAIDAQPLGLHTTVGRAADFSVVATSPLPLTYQWQVSTDGGATFADVPAAVAASLVLPDAPTAADGRYYRVRVSNAAGTTTSRAALLMVRPRTPSALFPLEPGSRWVYARSDREVPDVVQVSGTLNVEGGIGTVLETIDGVDGSPWRDVYVAGSDGVRQYAPPDGDVFTRLLSGMQILRLPVIIGESFQQVDQTADSGIDIDGDGLDDRLHVVSTLRVVGMEPLTTPAARFDSTLRQRQVITSTFEISSGRGTLVIQSEIDLWYADGVGLVHWKLRTTAPGVDDTLTQSLEAFRVGARRSDITPPAVSSISPAGAIQASTNTVSVTFDEHLDPASVTGDAVVLTDAQGRRVAGTARLREKTLWFSADHVLDPGSYGVRLAPGLRDRAGNQIDAGSTWTFAIDNSKPSVVSMTPASGSRDVPLSASMVIEFSEPVLPSSVGAWSIHLYDLHGTIPVSFTVSGNRVTVTPKEPLPASSTVTLRVEGVTDQAGHALVASAVTEFRTQQGRFAPAVPLGDDLNNAVAMAVGDVNGDGFVDVLAAPYVDQIPAVAVLYVLYGQPDRTLRAPQKLVLDALPRCSVSSIAIGDVTADGRPDVVVGAGYCGAQVLQQSAAGVLVPTQIVNGPAVLVRIADLDGNGKPVLITAAAADLRIWRRGAAGLQQSGGPLDTGLTRNADVVVVDLNGDGRRDIVAAGEGPLREIALLLRRPDGSFAAPSHLGTGVDRAVTAIGVADFNGDGRLDIIASDGAYSPSALTVFQQGAGGGFGSLMDVTAYNSAGSVAIADVDGDGLADVIVSHGGWGAVGVYRRRPDGTLALEERYPAPSCNDAREHLAVGDVDRDGRPDILMCGTLLRQVQGAAPSAARTASAMHAAVAGARRSLLRPTAAARGGDGTGGVAAAR